MEQSQAARQVVLGLDIAAATVVAVRQAAGQAAEAAQTFTNDAAGWAALLGWVATHGAERATALLVMEATGA